MRRLSYKDARPWAKSIANRVSRGLMPPWHADAAHGEFLNDRRLSDADRDTIVRWAWEEMMFTGLTYSVDAASPASTAQGQKP